MSDKDDSNDDAGDQCSDALQYYMNVFGGETLAEASREAKEAKLGHLRFEDTTPGSQYDIEVDDADVIVARAALHGGKIVQPVSKTDDDMREGVVEDPFGARWRLKSKGA